MKCYKYYFLLLTVTVGVSTAAQDLPDIERLLESNNIENTEEGYEDMVQTLLRLAVAPLNVNTASFDSLKLLFLLSDSQIDQILAFRKKYGHFLHLGELLWVPGIGRKDLENIRPFITIGSGTHQEWIMAVKKRVKHELLARTRVSLPEQEGYKMYSPDAFEKKKEYERKADNRFYGPPVGIWMKYKFTLGDHLQLGFTLENDAGEGYFTRYQNTGFDFLSAHLKVNSAHFFRQIILGDYRIQWGQGLVGWGGFTAGKSAVAVGNEKAGKGFTAYTSTDENNYLRGAAVSIQPCHNLTADICFSYKKTDGNTLAADTLTDEDWLMVSLYESGYHRNNIECRKKHALRELTAGFSLHWNHPFWKLGINALYYDFMPALIPGDRIYQQYNDTGDKRWLMSMDYKTAYRGFYLFGETACSDNGAWATLNGVRTGNSWVSGCVVYRRYDKRYVSRYAAGFGEFSNTSNEEGIYCGLDLSPVRNLKFNVYYDWFRFFSARYLATTPGDGWETLVEGIYQYADFEMGIRYKHEVRPEDVKGGLSVQRKKSEYRYQFYYHLNRQLELRTRFSVSQYHKDKVREWGWMVYQDLIWTTRKTNLKMQYRLAYFDTDSYQSRIYAYENNVLYGYSFPSFMGKGWRTYINMSWKPLKRLTCYLKSGFIIYPERDSISSGVTEVKGNKLYDIAFQIRLVI